MKHLLLLRLGGLSLAGSLLFCGCAVLTDSQVKNINSFAATTKAYCNYPSAVVKAYADGHQTLEIMDAAGQPDLPTTLALLDQARKSFQDNLRASGQVDVSLQLIQQYAALLVKLSSDQPMTDLRQPTEGLGENLDKAVALFDQKTGSHLAATAGSDLSKFILLAGQKLAKRKQTQALKAFVLEADTLIGVATGKLEEEMNNDMKALLQMDSARFAKDAQRVLAAENSKWERYQATRFYYEGITGYLTTDALRVQVAQAAASLRQAHKALVTNIQQKKDLKELIGELKQFIADVQPLGPIAGKYIHLPTTLSK